MNHDHHFPFHKNNTGPTVPLPTKLQHSPVAQSEALFISKSLTINRHATSAISIGSITTLHHETWNNSLAHVMMWLMCFLQVQLVDKGTMKWRSLVAIRRTLVAPEAFLYIGRVHVESWIILKLHRTCNLCYLAEVFNTTINFGRKRDTSVIRCRMVSVVGWYWPSAKMLAQGLEVCNGLWHMLSCCIIQRRKAV